MLEWVKSEDQPPQSQTLRSGQRFSRTSHWHPPRRRLWPPYIAGWIPISRRLFRNNSRNCVDDYPNANMRHFNIIRHPWRSYNRLVLKCWGLTSRSRGTKNVPWAILDTSCLYPSCKGKNWAKGFVVLILKCPQEVWLAAYTKPIRMNKPILVELTNLHIGGFFLRRVWARYDYLCEFGCLQNAGL